MGIGTLFWLLVLLCCGTGAIWGGRTGRQVAAVYVAACLLTIAASRIGHGWQHTQIPVMLVDLALLAALYAIALRTGRHYVLWMAGFHLVAVTTHFATLIAPAFTPRVYFILQSFWAVPILLALAAGVLIDRTRHSDDPASIRGPG